MSSARENTRRGFLGQLGISAAALSGIAGLPESAGAEGPPSPVDDAPVATSSWDMSCVDRLAGAKYRVAFDTHTLSDGLALDLAATFMDQYHEVYGTTDDQTRAVVVMRQLGVQMAFGDALWDKYAIGEEKKIIDPDTKLPARRNPWLRARAGALPVEAGSSMDRLRERGVIFLACNQASMNLARRYAENTKQDVETVKAEIRNGLVPGAILQPTGIFAMIRAQNAGAAFMRGAF